MDPKFSGLGTRHEALYTRLLGYTVAHDTAGLIPANAIALCGRGIYKRNRVLADLVAAGLILESTDHPGAFVFPISWQKYQQSSGYLHPNASPITKESPGGGRSLVRAGEEKRREEKISSREDRNTTGPVLMNLDGMMHELRNGQWEQINGKAPST
jgi:hypothetical protein